MALTWTTGHQYTDQQQIQFGIASGEYVHTANASRHVFYTAADMCGGVASGVGYR